MNKEIEEAKNFLYNLPNKIPLKFLTDEFCKQYDKIYDSIFEYIDKLEKQLKNSTPNSAIREKIKELKEKSGGNVFPIQQTINAEIRLLEKILEEGEK